MTSLPTRLRPVWPELPPSVRAGVEARLGASVTGWTSHDGGYSPGMASTLRTVRGDVFVKAVSTAHETSAHLYREEARRAVLVPEGVPAPRPLWYAEVDADDQESAPWIALAFESVAGSRPPRQPWIDAELDAVLRLCTEVARFEIPPGVLPDFAEALPTDRTAALTDELPDGLDSFNPWYAAQLDRLATIEESAADAVTGGSLVHADLRGDNSLLVDEPHGVRALAVDWPYASRGAAFCDLVAMLPATVLEGGPLPEEALCRCPLPPGTDGDAVTAYLVALTGYFVHSSLQAPPPGIPHVREFQRAQGEVCIAWLRRRLA